MKGSFLPGHKHVPHGAHPESEERVQAHPSSGGPRELFYMFDNYKLKTKRRDGRERRRKTRHVRIKASQR